MQLQNIRFLKNKIASDDYFSQINVIKPNLKRYITAK